MCPPKASYGTAEKGWGGLEGSRKNILALNIKLPWPVTGVVTLKSKIIPITLLKQITRGFSVL